jgi:hypothetical protein
LRRFRAEFESWWSFCEDNWSIEWFCRFHIFRNPHSHEMQHRPVSPMDSPIGMYLQQASQTSEPSTCVHNRSWL